jgi:hypothetical protein
MIFNINFFSLLNTPRFLKKILVYSAQIHKLIRVFLNDIRQLFEK